MSTTPSKGTALVTGASSGIGAVYAERLARRGYDLIVVARSRDKLDKLANRISNSTERSVEVLAADLSDRDDLARVEKTLRADSSITMLVNNAGFSYLAPFEQVSEEQFKALIDTNFHGIVNLMRAAIPAMPGPTAPKLMPDTKPASAPCWQCWRVTTEMRLRTPSRLPRSSLTCLAGRTPKPPYSPERCALWLRDGRKDASEGSCRMEKGHKSTDRGQQPISAGRPFD